MTERGQNRASLADQTVARVLGELRESKTACLAQVVELIREITARPDSISVPHLAEMIERDVAVVAEILRIANTIGYNPEGVEITTVAQAIQVIGFLKIRNLAVSLLLLKGAGQPASPRESREAAALAVACGQLAQVGMEQMGDRDPGQAFVCSALRHYGGLLLTTFMTEDHRRAVALGKTMAEDAAFREVFGLEPVELGRRVLEAMNLPSGILETFRPPPGESERKAMDASLVRLLSLTDVALHLADWLTGRGRARSLEALAAEVKERSGGVLEPRVSDLKDWFVELDRRLGVLRGPLGALPVFERVRAVAAGRQISPVSGGGAVPGVEARPDTSRLLLDGISEVSDLLGASPVRGHQVFLAGARCVEAALGLVDCWVFRRHAAEAHFRPFVGSGPLFPQLPARAAIESSRRSVFTVVVERAEIVLLTRPDDPKIAAFVPDWLLQVAGAAPLVLLPVGSAGQMAAVLCGVGEPGRLGELTPAVRQQLQVLGRLLALARDA